MPRRWASLKQAAEYLGLKEDRTIRGHIAAGLYPAYRLNERVVRVDLNDIDAVMRPIGGDV
ncbi:helix-turn-helix domain-containing protein [Mycobacterium marinum]|uniref:helix-turn-helix transcriptional regulator n=1 Tax=Mycobacterium marinum TaxID=1781 RepID=UPI0023595FC4|nr:DNA-binding protein [Mycobacterium marinum]WCS20121.1 helix-turn-helix domain-containing protein [Mycobacterium marinum]